MGGDAIFDDPPGAPRRRQRRDHRGRQGHPGAHRVQRGLRLRARRDGQLGVLRQPDPESAPSSLVDDLRAGVQVEPTRGAPLCTFKETARILAGFPDERDGRRRGERRRGPRLADRAAAGQGREPRARGRTRSGPAAPEGTRRTTRRPPSTSVRTTRRRRRRPPTRPTRPGPSPRRGSDDIGSRRSTETSPEKLLSPVLSAFWDEDRVLDAGRPTGGTTGTRACARPSP